MDNSDSRISFVCHHPAAARKPTFRSNSAPPPFSGGLFQSTASTLPAVSVDSLSFFLTLYLSSHLFVVVTGASEGIGRGYALEVSTNVPLSLINF